MNKAEIYKDMKKIGLSFLVAVMIFWIAFYKDSVFNIIRIVASFYWLFVIPGYMTLIHFRKEFSFIIRFVLGIASGLGIYGFLSYYLGLFGIHVNYHWFIVPLLISGISLFLLIKKRTNEE